MESHVLDIVAATLGEFSNLTSVRLYGSCALYAAENGPELNMPNLLDLRMSCILPPKSMINLLRAPMLKTLHLTFQSQWTFELDAWHALERQCPKLEQLLLANCFFVGGVRGPADNFCGRTAWPVLNLKRLALIDCAFRNITDGWANLRPGVFAALENLTLWKLASSNLGLIRAILGVLGRQHSTLILNLDDQRMSKFELGNLRRFIGTVNVSADLRTSQLWRN